MGNLRSMIGRGLATILVAVGLSGFASATDAAALQRTSRELRRYTLPDDQTSETREVPPRIRLLQTRFKHQLRGVVTDILNNDVNSISRPTDEIRTMARETFKRLRLITRTKEHLPLLSFGHVLEVSVSRPVEHPDFLTVGLVIDASWTQDESLYIFNTSPAGGSISWLQKSITTFRFGTRNPESLTMQFHPRRWMEAGL